MSVSKVRIRAVRILPGSGIRDHARAAIQLLSADIQRRTIFVHVGWRQIDGAWIYLHGGGGIGANGNRQEIEVALPNALQPFLLPEPPAGQELIDAWKLDLDLLEIAPDMVSVSLFLAIWRAAIAGADFAVHLSGPTGCFKTELAAIAMQHYGSNFNARSLPASWSSTGNSLEALAFVPKDSLLVIDDFAPSGSIPDVQRYHREAERVLRAQRNNAGRHRLRADASLRPSKFPRGLILSTGEDIPRGQSLRAGILVLELGPEDVNQQRLTQAQAYAANEIFAQSMAGFLKWAAGRYEMIGERLRSRLIDLRSRATASTAHRRTPEIVANLAVGLGLFLDFGIDIGAITEPEARRVHDRCWRALGQIAAAQVSHLIVNEPAQRFLELLGTAITSGRAHIADPHGCEPINPRAWGWRISGIGASCEHRPLGNRVGWLENESLFLDLDAALAAAQIIGREQGENIAVTPRTLSKRLHEKGLLLKTSADSRQTFKVRHTLEGRRREVLQVSSEVFGKFMSVEPDHEEPSEYPRDGESPSLSDEWSVVSVNPTRDSTIVTSCIQTFSTNSVGLGRSNTEEANVHSGIRESSLSCETQPSVASRDPTTNLPTAGDAEVSREELV